MTDLSRVLAETHREAMGRPAAAAPSTPARDVAPDTAAHLQEAGRVPWGSGDVYPAPQRPLMISDCTCVMSCADDPATACSLSGEPHVHPNRYPGDVFGPCPIHPDAPGDH